MVHTEKHSLSSMVKKGPLVEIPYSLSVYLSVETYSTYLRFKVSYQILTNVIYPTNLSDKFSEKYPISSFFSHLKAKSIYSLLNSSPLI